MLRKAKIRDPPSQFCPKDIAGILAKIWTTLTPGFSTVCIIDQTQALTWPDSGHVLNVLRELLVAVDVHDSQNLGQPDEGEAHGAVVVEQGQPILAGAGREEDADAEAKETGGTCYNQTKSESWYF